LRRIVLGVSLPLCVVLPLALAAQQPLAFDAVSVKRSAPSDTQTIRNQPGQYGTTNTSLRTVINQGFNVQSYQVVGGPDWIGTERWDISARMPAGTATQDQRRQMIQALLADRFKLKTHRETRELPIYALVVARSDGRLGPDLKPTTADCAAVRARRAAAPPARFSLDEFFECGMAVSTLPGGGERLRAQGMTMATLAGRVRFSVDRPVFDRTGLSGEFDLDLTYAASYGGDLAAASAAPGDAPLMFTALQERLGLKLESAKGPIEVLVIDSVERPVEN
jgi:uncharacterized protein (TIGR03435 family)